MSNDILEGRFTVKGHLRCAGVGSLVCAEDKHDGSRTAIRLIPEMASGQAAVAAALKMPVHPVLPRAIGSGASNGSSWVAIDFPEGELLAQKSPLDTAALLTMGSMVAGALTALHQNGIVHGELSTESVLVVPARATNSLRYVLFDAPLVVMNRLTDRRGEERLLSQLTHLVPFLSPERARGVEASQASDVWAFGMILSLASGAKAVPGDSTLEKIAAIVTNKWRPAVSPSLPIALRLLLTRMLAPDPKDRPSSLDVALELETLCVAFTAHQQVTAQTAQSADTNPLAQFRIEKLAAQTKLAESSPKIEDPFEALVAAGVSAKAMDPHAEPTKQNVMGLTEVTDPRAPLPPPVPTTPARGQNLKTAPAAAPAPLAVPETVKLIADEVAALPLIIPAHPAAPHAQAKASPPAQQRRTPMPLPPILDPAAVVVAPQPRRTPVPAPMPKIAQAPVMPLNVPQTETMRYGALPGADRPPKVPQNIITEDVAQEAAQARAEVRAEALTAKVAPVPDVPMAVVNTDVGVPSVHDEAEEAFARSVQAASKRRTRIAMAIAAALVVLVGGSMLISALSGPSTPAVDPKAELKEAIRKSRAKKVVAAAEADVVAQPEEELAPLEQEAKPEPVVAAKPEPMPEPEPVAAKPEPVVKAEPKPEPQPEPVVAKPEPKPEPVAKAPPPAKASGDLKRPSEAVEPVAAKPVARARPAAKKDDAPRRPASRLDEGD